MFIGEYTNKIDEKGRLAIAPKFRADLAGGAVVTKGLDGCLFIYTKDEWAKLAERLKTLSVTGANARAISRHFFAGAVEIEPDKQGRINLPSYLRSFAELNGTVVVAGLFDRLEIWDEAAWKTYQTKTESTSAEIAEQLIF